LICRNARRWRWRLLARSAQDPGLVTRAIALDAAADGLKRMTGFGTAGFEVIARSP